MRTGELVGDRCCVTTRGLLVGGLGAVLEDCGGLLL